MKNILKHSLLLSGILTLFVACGGAGGTTPSPGGGSGDGGGGATGLSYLFYSGFFPAGSSDPDILFAVDPETPSTPIAIEATEKAIKGTIRSFRTGDYNGSTRILSDWHSEALIYAKTDGKFYRVDGEKSGSLSPVQLSNESAADQLCTKRTDGLILLSGRAVISDLENPNNSQYVYSFPGSDGLCGNKDDEWKMLRLGMTATDSPIAAKQPVRVLIDSDTGAISGWLVNDAGVLRECDLNFSVCGASITSIGTEIKVLLDIDNFDRFLLEIDRQLFIYDARTRALSASVFTIPEDTFVWTATTDGTDVYFSHNTLGTDNAIYQFPADGSTAAIVLATEEKTIQTLRLTTNKLVYQVGNEIKSTSKAGGISNVLVSASEGENLSFLWAGDYIYYSILNLSSSIPTLIKAGIVDENGINKTEFLDSSWVGLSIYADSLDLNLPGDGFFEAVGMILAEGGGAGFSGTTLKVFDGVTATPGVTLGTLPSVDDLTSINCSGFESNVLCTVMVSIPSTSTLPFLSFQSDVFFVNALTEGSLARVTNSGDKNEAPVFF